jgi:hypothetical protein
MNNRIPRALVLEGRDTAWDMKTERERKKDARIADQEKRERRIANDKKRPQLFVNSRRFRHPPIKMKDTRPIELKEESRTKGINPRKRKALNVRRERSFKAKEKKQKILKYTVVNTVFAMIRTEDIPANAMKQDYYVQGTSMWRACGRRVRFRKNILYPSVKEKGIVDPLLLQYITNVPEKLSGFRCFIGNNRLTLLKEYPELNIEELPCFVINIKGEGGDFEEPIIEGELINTEEKALEYYKYTDTYLKHGRKLLNFAFNEDGWLIDVKIRRFLGEY